MSRPAGAMNTGQTNKKFLYMAGGLGLLGAILVYVAFSRSSGSGGVTGADQVPVVVAKTDIAARTKITASMVQVKLVRTDDASSQAFADTADAVGKITRFPITANEQVISSKVVDLSGNASPSSGSVAGKSLSFTVPPGQRAIAVNVTEVAQVGGLLLPGDYVDVLIVYDVDFANDPGDPASHEKATNFVVQTLFQNKEVLAVSQTIVDLVEETGTAGSANASAGNAAGSTLTSDSDQRVRNTEAKPTPAAATITLALSPEETQKFYLAVMNGKVRFSLRSFGDNEQRPIDIQTQFDLFQRNLPNPFIH